MKSLFKKVILAAGFLLAVGVAHATSEVAYSGTFVGTEGLATTNGNAVSANYTRDINTTGDRLSLQVTYSTYTVAISTNFGSGQYVLNQPTITIAGISTGWVTGMQVLYSTGSVAISGLTNQTTYYLSVISGGGTGGSSTTNPVVFKLASSLANAVAGTGIVLASSSAVTNRYTLAPLGWTNVSGGIQFQVSDDNSNWINLTTGNYGATISSVTFSSAGASSIYDLGLFNHRYLRIKETPAATGATVYTIKSNEKWPVQH